MDDINEMTWVMQFIADVPEGADPDAMLKTHTSQEGCIGGRVLFSKNLVWDTSTRRLVPGSTERKRIQVFFPDPGKEMGLPDGCLRVMLPASLRRVLQK